VHSLPTNLKLSYNISFCHLISQDPTNLDKFNVSNFFHVKNNLKVLDPGEFSVLNAVQNVQLVLAKI